MSRPFPTASPDVPDADDGDVRFELSTRRVCAILNPGSGRQDGARTGAVLTDRLRGACGELAVRPARHGRELVGLARQAVRDGFDVVVAVGGDGTQAAVAGALAGTDVVMGVVPGGTFNYFARELGVGDTVETAADTLLSARARRVDVGDLNGTVFLNNVSFGAYPDILERREGIYRRWGRSRIAAYWSVISALANLRRPMALTTCVDGAERHHTSALVFVAKSAFQLESFGLEGAEAVRAGQLAVLVAHATRPRQLIGAALRLALGRTARGDDFDLLTADELVITTRPATRKVAHDGEKQRMTGPFRLKVRHGALTVLVPAAQGDTDADGQGQAAAAGAGAVA